MCPSRCRLTTRALHWQLAILSSLPPQADNVHETLIRTLEQLKRKNHWLSSYRMVHHLVLAISHLVLVLVHFAWADTSNSLAPYLEQVSGCSLFREQILSCLVAVVRLRLCSFHSRPSNTDHGYGHCASVH